MKKKNSTNFSFLTYSERNGITVCKFDVSKAGEDLDLGELGHLHYGWVDKTETGTGCTSFALEKSVNKTVIVLPSRQSAMDKLKGYKNVNFPEGESVNHPRCNHLVLGVWGDEKITDDFIKQYFLKCVHNQQNAKIICVYDSLYKLEPYLENFDIVLDEMQKIIEWAKMKTQGKKDDEDNLTPDAYTRMLNICEKNKDRVTFLSATPLGQEYYPEWVGQLKRYRYIWNIDSNRQPIMVEANYPYSYLQVDIVRNMKKNGFCEIKNGDDVVCKIEQAIIYINSVKNIVKIIDEENLDKDEYAIICSDNARYSAEMNGKKMLVSGDKIDNLKYIFVTSRGFDTIDLSHPTSMDIVVSSTDQDYHMISKANVIQCIGRNRDENNSHRNHFLWIYDRMATCRIEEKKKELEENIKRVESNCKLLNEQKQGSSEGTENTYEFTRKTMQESSVFKTFTYLSEDTQEWMTNELTINSSKYTLNEVAPLYATEIESDNVWTRIKNGEKPIRIIVDNNRGTTTFSAILKRYRLYAIGLNDHSLDDEQWKKDSFTEEQLRSEMFSKIDSFYRRFNRIPEKKKELDVIDYTDNAKDKQLAAMIKSKFVVKRYKNSEVKKNLESIYNDLGLTNPPKSNYVYFLSKYGYKVKSFRGHERGLEIISTPK